MKPRKTDLNDILNSLVTLEINKRDLSDILEALNLLQNHIKFTELGEGLISNRSNNLGRIGEIQRKIYNLLEIVYEHLK